MFTDTHAHIFHCDYENIEQIIQNAKENNINRIILSGYNKKTNKEVLQLVNEFDEFYGVIGYHPTETYDITEKDILDLQEMLDNPKILGIGEIGLDYHYENTNKEIQKKYFNLQLSLAEKLNLPVVIHSRDAGMDVLDIIKKYNIKGVIHSFSGSLELANEYIKKGFILGISGVITFKNCKLINILDEIDIKNIILETDSPYLTPVPYRGQRNEPAYIMNIVKFICENQKIDVDQLSKFTNANIKSVFDI